MSKDKKPGYLGSNIPEKPKAKQSRNPVYASDDNSYLYARLDELNEQLVKQNRDRLDSEYNVGWDNLDEEVQNLFSSYEDNFANIHTWAEEMTAGFEALAEWKDDASEAIAELQGEVGEGYATVSMIAAVTDSDGNVTAASIAAAVNDSGSSVMIEADKIEMTGTTTFLTGSDVGDGGSAVIAGNRISLSLDGTGDDGQTSLESTNEIKFIYDDQNPQHAAGRNFASIYTDVDGNDTSDSSRYALNIEASTFVNAAGNYADASLKLKAEGRVSISGYNGVYLSNGAYGDGYITADANDNTRIRANKSYQNITNTAASTDWVFCTDGIYYNGTRIVAV